MNTPIIHVAIYGPLPGLLPLAELDINPSVVACSVDTQLPGGFGRCRIGLLPPGADLPAVYPFLPEAVPVYDGCHVVVSCGGLILSESVVVTVAPNRRGFESEGYGIWAPRWGQIDHGGAQRVTSGVVYGAAIQSVAWLQQGETDDPGGYHAWSEFQHRTASEVIAQLSTEGGLIDSVTRVPWMFTVYDDRIARFVAQTPPALPQHILTYDPARMDVGWAYGDVCDAVRIVYTDASGTMQVSPWFYRPGVDQTSAHLRRETLSGSASADGALAVALTYRDEHSTPNLPGTIQYSGYDGIGIRAGEWVSLEGYGESVITQTACDLMTGESSVTLGQPRRGTLRGFLGELAGVARAATRNTDVTTMARAG